ncbi:MAG: TIM barrel protein [Actinomycetia bacterium]|nr:TIM barrel protein [Actinomycetes bacterium]
MSSPSPRLNLLDRLVGAPISWGVCEVPGWGLELGVDRVLREMREVGMVATELGPEGYFASDPILLAKVLEAADLPLVGGFVPLVLHDRAEHKALVEAIHRNAGLLSGGGATIFATSGVASWDWAPRRDLTSDEWSVVAESLALVEDIVADYGLEQAVHPHVGTIIETAADVTEVLERTSAGWCYDTGHLLIGGYDPLQFLADARDRIRHVHLKDVHMATAQRVLDGELTLMEGVQAGMFCAMGSGDVPIGQIVTELENSGYDRWYVLEQDAALTEGEPPEGSGPKLDVLQSVDYLRSVARELASPGQ